MHLARNVRARWQNEGEITLKDARGRARAHAQSIGARRERISLFVWPLRVRAQGISLSLSLARGGITALTLNANRGGTVDIRQRATVSRRALLGADGRRVLLHSEWPVHERVYTGRKALRTRLGTCVRGGIRPPTRNALCKLAMRRRAHSECTSI